MSFSAIIRNSASRLARVGRRRPLSRFPTAPALSRGQTIPVDRARLGVSNWGRGFCSTAASTLTPSSNESLLRVIETEIHMAQESDFDQVEEVPEGYPFKIDDNPGKQTITLTREYDSEQVKVEVYMPDLVTGDDNEIDDDKDDEDDSSERPTQSNIPLFITISKKSGTTLEFSCIAYGDRIAIQSLAINNPETPEEHTAYAGPDFSDLDDELQAAFHKYLEFRGVTPSITNFLHEYMINKDSREYVGWLKNLKTFIEA